MGTEDASKGRKKIPLRIKQDFVFKSRLSRKVEQKDKVTGKEFKAYTK